MGGRHVARLLFHLARTPLLGGVVGWSFTHLSSLVPVQRLYETDVVVAFRHPRPAYPLHILIVPKRPVRSLQALAPADGVLLQEVVAAAQHLVGQLGLERRGYRLIVNGGRYQDVPQLHFHLVSGR